MSTYDWGTHLPKMIGLYEMDVSIPSIHKEIQLDEMGFNQKYVKLVLLVKFNFVRIKVVFKLRPSKY